MITLASSSIFIFTVPTTIELGNSCADTPTQVRIVKNNSERRFFINKGYFMGKLTLIHQGKQNTIIYYMFGGYGN